VSFQVILAAEEGGLTAWLRTRTGMGEFFALVITFVIIAVAAKGTKEAGTYLVREGKMTIFGAFLVALGAAAIKWWEPGIGGLTLAAGILLMLWPAFRGAARATRRIREYRDARERRREIKEARAARRGSR
jgi:hypothetical protein